MTKEAKKIHEIWLELDDLKGDIEDKTQSVADIYERLVIIWEHAYGYRRERVDDWQSS
jgi:arabinogalactan endo-1,4-beta-galactosidase